MLVTVDIVVMDLISDFFPCLSPYHLASLPGLIQLPL